MKKGFTLVELMVVMSILLILSALALMYYVNFKFDTEVRVDASNAKLYTNGILYYENVKQRPYVFQDEDTMFDDLEEIGFVVNIERSSPKVDHNGSWYFDNVSYLVRAKISIDKNLFDQIGDQDKMYFDNN